MTKDLFSALIPLPRTVIHVGGIDAESFLQGLVSNDVTLLHNQVSIFACLLSPQGKFLHEIFIIKDINGGFYLETEESKPDHDLATLLIRYKLRKQVTITPRPDMAVMAGAISSSRDIIAYPDTRHPDMPGRALVLNRDDIKTTGSFDDWDETRIRLGVPDGTRDAGIGISTLEELNLTRLNAVSFTKGCYLGQELTARMQNRNLGKRHLQTVRLDNIPNDAELRSSCRGWGLALIRD